MININITKLPSLKTNPDILLFVILSIIVGYFIWQNYGHFWIDTPTAELLANGFTPGNRFFDTSLYLPKMGRFVPLTHITYAFFYFTSNNSLFGIFLGTFILYGLTVACIFHFMRKLDFSIWQVAFTTLLIFTQTPIAENLLTIGKAQVLQTSLGVFYIVVISKFVSYESKFLLHCALLSLLSLLMILTSETSIALIAPLAFILVLTMFFRLGRQLLTKVSLALGIFFFTWLFHMLYIRIFDVLPIENPYSAQLNRSIGAVLTNLRLYMQLTSDIFVVGGVSLVGNAYLFYGNRNNRCFLIGLFTSVWGWAYVGGMMFWPIVQPYYMLIPSTFFILSLVFVVKEIKKPLSKKAFHVAMTVLAFIYIQHTFYNARFQGDLNVVHTSSMLTVSEIISPDSNLYFEDLCFFQEPVHQTNIYHNILRDNNINIFGLGEAFFYGTYNPDVLRLHFADEFVTVPAPKIDDYIILFPDQRPQNLMLEARGAFRRNVASRLVEQHGYTLELVSAMRLDRRHLFLGMGNMWGPVETSIGYRLYRVTDVPAFNVRGVYADGWTGRSFEILGFANEIPLLFNLNQYSFAAFPQNEMRVYVDGTFIESINFDYTSTQIDLTYVLTGFVGQTVDIRIDVMNTFIPYNDFPPQQDMRELGLNLSVYGN